MYDRMTGTSFSSHYPAEFSNKKYYIRVLTILGLALALSIIGRYNFLLAHSIAEGFSIVIASGIFMIIWNSRKFIENNFFIIIGIGYASVSILDFVHSITYNGVNIFTGITSDPPTQLWVAARYIQSFSFLIAVILVNKNIKLYKVISAYGIIISLVFLSVFYYKVFPSCYIEGYGLTPFKKISEFIISFIFFLSIAGLHKRKEYFNAHLYNLVIASNIISIISELDFTLYTSTSGPLNLLGHLLKVVSFYLIYEAIVVSGLKDPFNILFTQLKQKEKALQLTRFSIEHAEGLFFWIKMDGSIYDFNKAAVKKLGYKKEELKKTYFHKLLANHDENMFNEIKVKVKQRESFFIDHAFITGANETFEFEIEFNYLEFEGDEYYCAIARDITERRRYEAKLLESEARFRSLADTAPVMIWMTNENKQCIYCNKPWLEFTGRALEDELGYGWFNLIHPDDKPGCFEAFSNAFDGKHEFNFEGRFLRQDNQYRWFFTVGIPRFTTEGNFLGFVGSSFDMTELKQSREMLEKTLKEKVILLKEIHHRVKNNLQVISSLFNLQSAYLKDDETRKIFMESQNRVRSMALIHEKLYLANNSSCINFPEYLRELITNLLSSYKFNLNTIELDLKMDDMNTSVDLAVYLGLILNELISNAFKHAFPDGRAHDGSKCKLSVLLCAVENKRYTVIIKDNGCGFPEELDFRNTNSLGLQLVTSLADQIRGTIELKRDSGTEFILSFEVKN